MSLVIATQFECFSFLEKVNRYAVRHSGLSCVSLASLRGCLVKILNQYEQGNHAMRKHQN
jgi:hypothetical protein